MGFGDSLKKKLQDAAKAVGKAVDDASKAPTSPGTPAMTEKPPRKADPNATLVDEELQARMAAESDEPQEEEDDDDTEEGVALHQADGLEFPVPVGWGVSDLTNEEFWTKVFDIEGAQMQGGATLKKALAKYDLDSEEHFGWIRERFMARHAADPDFQQSMMNARMAQTRQQMQSAMKPGALDPVEGVTMETYATIQARRGKLSPPTVAAFGKLLAEYSLDEAKWARVDKGWMARMSDPSDPMATAAINTEYGKYYAAAGQGQFGAGAKAASANLGVKDAVGKAPAAGEPCTFDRYIEIMTAQSCWAQQGKDVNAMLKKAFSMTAMDWSNLSASWAQKMMSDIKLMTETMPALQAKYQERYSAPSQDDDLSV
jgi:hypothetical protein